jgi:hypothetical protein
MPGKDDEIANAIGEIYNLADKKKNRQQSRRKKLKRRNNKKRTSSAVFIPLLTIL